MSDPNRALGQVHGWSMTTARNAHACNCIGCCRRCGTCRTWPGHTPAYCDLLVKQAAERAALLDTKGAERLGSAP